MLPAIAASLAIRYRLDGRAVVFACDGFAVEGDLLAVPYEAWRAWAHLQLLVRPVQGAPRAELVVGDLRGRYLRSTDGHARELHARGALLQRLEFADGGARGMSFRLDARAGDARGHLQVVLLPALATLRPPPARLPALSDEPAVIRPAS